MSYKESSCSMDPESWFDLSKSGYAKVIFSDLYHDPNSSVGCKFQITNNVDEHPSDYIGLFKVGYKSLNQCIVSKVLSQIESIEDEKFLHCTFKIEELPPLENGFYQFLYITKDEEVCGASLAFEIKQPKSILLVEDIVADNIEDDFLVVRSTLAEQNRDLLHQIEQIKDSSRIKEKLFTDCIEVLEKDKKKLTNELKLAYLEKDKLSSECKKVLEEKDDIRNANDETIKNLEEQIKGITLNVENTCKAFQELENEKNNLEKEMIKVTNERDLLDSNLSKLTHDYEVVTATVELLQREIKLKEEAINTCHSPLISQLENAQQMIEALGDSKKLARDEVTQLTETNEKLRGNQEQLKNQNIYLESKLKDNYALLEQYQKRESQLKVKIHELEAKLKSLELTNEKLRESEKALIKQVLELRSQESARETEKKLKCQILALELKLKDVEKTHEAEKKLQSQNMALEFKKDIEKYQKEEYKLKAHIHDLETKLQDLELANKRILSTSCSQVKHESVRCRCAELQTKLINKDDVINTLKEEATQKDAVLEYLSKEKNNLKKHNMIIGGALKDSVLRLKDAADIYKTQYLEIEKLKKKLNKVKSIKKGYNTGSSCNNDELQTTTENIDGVLSESVRASQQSNSDSDTGEHVTGQCFEGIKSSIAAAAAILDETLLMTIKSAPAKKISCEECQSLSNDSFSQLSYPNNQDLDLSYLEDATKPEQQLSSQSRESPELQSLVAKNLAEFSLSNISSEEQFAIPCPVCNADIGINTVSSEEMIKHLEIQHKQRICPMCGKLFDMTLPSKYFEYHVEDHFLHEK